MTDPEIVSALAAPFDADEVKFKPAVVSGSRALALAYVDARVIQDRLDAVMGVAGWQDEYEILPDGSVVCKLRLRLAGEWITKMDVGGPSEQPDEGDRRKAAFSDALKRAAVKFGVGRYLHRLPAQWCDYDAQKKQFVRKPTLPAGATTKQAPAGKKAEQSAGTPLAGPEELHEIARLRGLLKLSTEDVGKLVQQYGHKGTSKDLPLAIAEQVTKHLRNLVEKANSRAAAEVNS